MKKKHLVVLAVVVSTVLFFVIVLFLIGTAKNNNPVTLIANSDQADLVVYKRAESWGPCRSKELSCTLNTRLYESRRLVFSGDYNEEVIIDQDTYETIINEIIKSGVMKKGCMGAITLDYTVSYELNINGVKKQIGNQDTGCWKEMIEVDRLINSYIKHNRQGGV